MDVDPRLEGVALTQQYVNEKEGDASRARQALHREIIRAYKEGMSPRRIAEVCQYSHQTIRTIIKGET